MRFLKDESGQALVLVALSLVVILGFAGLAIDVGQLRFAQLRLQTAADAAALAAAMEIQQCGTTSNCATMQSAAKTAVTENGLDSPTILAQCAAGSGTGLTLTINNGPCALGANDPELQQHEVCRGGHRPAATDVFRANTGISSLPVAARAEAGLGASTVCLGILSPTAPQALLLNGSASLSSSCRHRGGFKLEHSAARQWERQSDRVVHSCAWRRSDQWKPLAEPCAGHRCGFHGESVGESACSHHR